MVSNDSARESRNRSFRTSMLRASESTDEHTLAIRFNEAKAKFEELDTESKEIERLNLEEEHARGSLSNVKIRKNGNTYEFTVSVKERKKIKKGPIILVTGLMFFAALFGIVVVEHPADSIEIDAVTDSVYVGEDNTIFVKFVPSYTTDTTLEWFSDCSGVTFEVTEEGTVIRVSPAVPDGTKIEVTAKSMKYGVSDSIVLDVVNDSYLDIVCGNSVAAGKTITASLDTNASWEKSPVWETDCDWAVTGKSGYKVSVRILPDAVKGDSFTLTCSIPGTSMKTEKRITVSESLELSIMHQNTTIDAGGSFDVEAGFNTELPNATVSWSVVGSHVTIEPNGLSAKVRLDYSVSAGDEFTVIMTLDKTRLFASETFVVTRGIEPCIECGTDTLTAGTSANVAVVSPIVPPGAEIVWELEGQGAVLEGNGANVTVKGLPELEHGSKIVLTVHYKGYGASATLTLDTVNEARRFIEVSNAAGMLDIGKAPGRNYRLTCDIDLSAVQWVPFRFSGTLDGGGHTITGMTFSERNRVSSGSYYGGLFSVNDGTIMDLSLDSSSIVIAPDNLGDQTSMSSGFFAGNNSGTITNCDVTGSDMLVHSTDIKVKWMESRGKIPSVGGDGRSGDWYDYASLSYSGTKINNWKQDKGTWLQCGGIVGTNSGKVTVCTVNNCSMDIQIVNFQHSNSVRASYTELLVGGGAGYNSGTLSVDVFGCEATCGLVLHDSGDGSLGYIGSSSYEPKGAGYIGGVCGVSSNSVMGNVSQFDSTAISEAYSPVYMFLKGAYYNANGCYSTDNINWDRGDKIGMMQ